MQLAKFLELNDQEKFQQIKLLSLKKRLDPDFFNQIIEQADQEVLFKLAINNTEIDAICKAPEFKSHWEDMWRLCGANPKEHAVLNHEPVHEYQPMPTVSSCFDLLKGLYLYENYRKIFKDMEHTQQFYDDVEEFLATSGNYGCFFALNALCKGGLELLSHKFDDQIAEKIIFYAQIAAKYYLSAGYLLLANVYQELLKYQSETNLVGRNLSLQAFQAMSIAKRLEQYSAPMLNNAYQGKTLAEASNGQITSFSQALFRLQRHLNLSPLEIEMSTNAAITEAAAIKKIYKLEESFIHTRLDEEPISAKPRIL
ncbi:DUF5630 domain-containing protein [Fluoribacter gormanii]|uniref:Uncharacterized protein n=1 Tax=Fluoribacter gormanii TaxID=464 RepID=A0A377GK19_9GAMM|nr:DUF5630 domain-containing protein [Fluoribacter gormanii]KTD01393.1 hypothetical protein Lgor_2459 [Fluoribacter gormanii]SIR47426.1 hypothetical protein SAMN05421777_11317 [Fluoribacter gormanii]STO24875.1 Uncharacterised protein [Fluoribacter gormanii]